MSDKARERLGNVENLLDHFDGSDLAEARRFLSDAGAPDILTVRFGRGQGASAPVVFSCLGRIGSGVVLSAEVRERAADQMGPVNEELLWLQGVVLEKYFRLLRVQQSLDSRLGRTRNVGLLVIEQLERERSRLGSELHSGVGQALSAINVHVELIQKEAPDLPDKVRRSLDTIASAAREAGDEARALSRALYTPHWQSLTLEQALRKLWHESGIPEKLQGSLTIGELRPEPAPAVKSFVYRAAQETMANALRHSQATIFSFALSQVDGRLRLMVEDNGRGFDPAMLSASAGIGLRSLRDQADALGGEFHLASDAGGTKLEVAVPLEP